MIIDHETSCPCIYCSPRARRQPTTQELLAAAKAENENLTILLTDAVDGIGQVTAQLAEARAENQKLRDHIIGKLLEEG